MAEQQNTKYLLLQEVIKIDDLKGVYMKKVLEVFKMMLLYAICCFMIPFVNLYDLYREYKCYEYK